MIERGWVARALAWATRERTRGASRAMDWSGAADTHWDVRNLIVLDGGGAGTAGRSPAGTPGLLALRLAQGRQGLGGLADLPPRASPHDDARLTVLGWGTWGEAGSSDMFSPEHDLVAGAGGLVLASPGNLALQGSWPAYRIEFELPGAPLRAELEVRAGPEVTWWFQFGRLASMGTAFAEVRGRIAGAAGEAMIEAPGLIARSRGTDLRRVSREGLLPLSGSRFETGHLEGIGTFALGSVRIGRRELLGWGSLRRPDGRELHFDRFEVQEGAWRPVPDRCLGEAPSPLAWRVSATGPSVRLDYSAAGRGPGLAASGRLVLAGATVQARLEITGEPVRTGAGLVLAESLAGPCPRRKYGI